MSDNKSSQDQVPRESGPQVNDPAPQSPSPRPDPVNLDQGGNPTPVGDAPEPVGDAEPKNNASSEEISKQADISKLSEIQSAGDFFK